MRRVFFTLLALVLAVRLNAAGPTVRLPDLDNRPVDPFLTAESSQALVFLFASVDCPISNRYAPVVQRLYQTFAPQGVAFWLIYPNPAETPAAIREHIKAFNYPVHALRDPKHELVKLTNVVVTPEVALFDRTRALVYHGRIDDRYVSLGVERPSPTRSDLADALTATLSGARVKEASTQAVGCFIADFVQ
jgi:AhpC/TSA family protein